MIKDERIAEVALAIIPAGQYSAAQARAAARNVATALLQEEREAIVNWIYYFEWKGRDAENQDMHDTITTAIANQLRERGDGVGIAKES